MGAPKQAEAAYTISEAADLKRVSTSYVRAAIRTGALRAKKVGKGYRIAASSLEDWFSSLEDA